MTSGLLIQRLRRRLSQRLSRISLRSRLSHYRRADVERLEHRWMLAADSLNNAVVSAPGLPIAFERNLGQAAPEIDYLARGNDYVILIEDHQLTIGLPGTAAPEAASSPSDMLETTTLSMQLLGANADAVFTGRQPLAGRAHYYYGPDPAQWIVDVPTYQAVIMEDAWDGIDAVYYGIGAQLEYDFVVAPGSDPDSIRFQLSDTDGISLADNGSLVVHTALGDLVHQAPVIYQDIGGIRQHVSGRFIVFEHDVVGFEVDSYDTSHPLVIDPILSYSSSVFSGVNARNAGVKLDAAGHIYLAGDAREGLPTTSGAAQETSASPGQKDGFVIKLDPTGTQVMYSTYLGGNWVDEINDFDVDAAGSIYLTGRTQSGSFPVLNALQPQINLGGSIMDAFVTRLDPSGQLTFSTYLGGSGNDIGYGIAVDETGDIYVTGNTSSADYVTTAGALQTSRQGTSDAFVTKLKGDGSGLLYSTYLGGNSNQDNAADIAVDADGNVYIVGATQSTNFPTTAAAFQTSKSINSSNADAFITKLDPTGSSLIYSSYLGGSGNEAAWAVAVDPLGFAYVAGDVSLNVSAFPTTPGAYQTAATGPGSDMFVTRFAMDGSSLAYSTLLGGGVRRISGIDPHDNVNDLVIDAAGQAYLVGVTNALDYPLVNPLRGFVTQSVDGVLSKLSADGSSLLYSTRLGGISADGLALHAGKIYVVGRASPLPTFDFFTPLTTELAPPFGGQSSDFTYLVTIAENINQPPVLELLGDASLAEGDVLEFTATASDANLSDELVFRLIDAPPGASIDPDTGDVRWQTDESHGPGSFTFTVEVSDGMSSDEATMTVTVAELAAPPVIDAGGPYLVAEGDQLQLAAIASDPDLPVDTLLVVEWDLDGDGQFGETGSAAERGDELGVNPAFSASELDDGDYPVTARVTDSTGLWTTQIATVSVTNRSPELAKLTVTQLVDEGQAAILSGLLRDAGPDALTLLVDWGDGSAPEEFSYSPGTTSFAETHAYADKGTFVVQVSLADDDGDYYFPDLLVSNFVAAGRVHRFDGETGGFLELFVASGSSGLSSANDVAFGPDGNVYVASRATRSILRYDGASGAFLGEFASTGSSEPTGIVFGPDGQLYVASGNGDSIQRFNGQSGLFLDEFVAGGSGGLNDPREIVFGPDGRLYATSRNPNAVFRYDGRTGTFLDVFVNASANGGLAFPQGMVFGTNGHLYVGGSNGVFEYDGVSGAFLRKIGSAAGGLAFGPDAALYASVVGQDRVLRYDVNSGQLVDTFVPPGSGGLDAPSFLTFFPTETTVVVQNVAPTLTLAGAEQVVEGATYSLSLSASDPGQDTIQQWVIDWGDGSIETLSGNPTAATHVYADGNNAYTIRAHASDEDGTYSAANEIDIEVRNVGPSVLSITTDAASGPSRSEDEVVLLTLNFYDPGLADEHTVQVNWGDGRSESYVLPIGHRQLVASHIYSQGGVYAVSAIISDGVASDARATTSIISGVGVQDHILWIIGTAQDDHVVINESARDTLRIHANFVEDRGGRRVEASSVKTIAILLWGGDDKLTIAGNIDLPAMVDMGDGDDMATGGRGPSLILGGSGNDHLLGSRGRNILIGGGGVDRLIGGSEDDLLFGGNYRSDHSDRFPFDSDLVATWRAWATCERHERHGQPGIDDYFAFLSRLDDDGERDLLTGSAGDDWFVLHDGDRANDGKKRDVVIHLS